jgi:large subunit ribosomal protein L13
VKTYSAKPSEVTRKWYLFDASEAPLGRLSTQAATLLTGKGKPMYTPHIDCGDYVVVINSDKLIATGDKFRKKIYYRHSQYPGSLKSASLEEMVVKDSTKVIENSIRRMLPNNKLRDQRVARLKIYKGSEHNNTAQKPEAIDLKGSK